MNVAVAVTADASPLATIEDDASVWHQSQVREKWLGANRVVGRGAYTGTGVQDGDNFRIQNDAFVYESEVVGDGGLIGPTAVLTNDHIPRSVNPDGSLKSGHDMQPLGVTIRADGFVGARAACVGALAVGRWALAASGAALIQALHDPTLPAKRGWVGRAGVPLEPHPDEPGRWTGRRPEAPSPRWMKTHWRNCHDLG